MYLKHTHTHEFILGPVVIKTLKVVLVTGNKTDVTFAIASLPQEAGIIGKLTHSNININCILSDLNTRRRIDLHQYRWRLKL